MHRDHWVWWLGIVGAVLTACANSAGLFPAEWARYINLAALIVGVVSGKLATSPLPGEHDAGKVDVAKTTITKALLPFVLLSTISWAACRPPASVVTEPGKRAYYAAQVLQRVSEVQNLVIQLNAATPPVMSTAQTRVVVQFCVSAAKVLKSADEGWAKVVLAMWREVQAQLPASVVGNPQLVTLFAVLDSLLTTFAGAQP